MDYFTRTYVSGKPYSIQKSFMRARPQTNVKLMTTNRSQVNYPSTPSATLCKPYQHDTYNSMPYLFSGYPAVRRNWFDSKVGGQSSDGYKKYNIPAFGMDGYVSYTGEDAWSDVIAKTSGTQRVWTGSFCYSSAGRYNAVIDPLTQKYIFRSFIGFNLKGLKDIKIKSAAILITNHGILNNSVICLQASNSNSQGQPKYASYSSFYGPIFSKLRFQKKQNSLEFNESGVKYLTENRMASFCIREYEHDYLGVEPAIGDVFSNVFVSSEIPNSRPTLIINY